jgi:hypothetical protein
LRDPELSVDEVVRLASDPEVRYAALWDSRVPAALLQSALLEPSGAFYAAANPAVPVAVMDALLDLASAPEDSGDQAPAPGA